MNIASAAAGSHAEFLDAIGAKDFSMVLSGQRLRDWRALEALQALRGEREPRRPCS